MKLINTPTLFNRSGTRWVLWGDISLTSCVDDVLCCLACAACRANANAKVLRRQPCMGGSEQPRLFVTHSDSSDGALLRSRHRSAGRAACMIGRDVGFGSQSMRM